jgi:hypothetical protein
MKIQYFFVLFCIIFGLKSSLISGQAGFQIIEDPDARITASEVATWVLEWTPDRDYAGPVNIVLQGDFNRSIYLWKNFKSFESLSKQTKVTWHIVGDVPYSSVMGRFSPEKLNMAVIEFSDGAKKSASYRFKLTTHPPKVLDTPLALKLVVKKGEQVLETFDPVTLRVRAGQVAHVFLVARPVVESDQCVRLVINPADKLGYPTKFEKPVKAHLVLENKKLWQGKILGTTILYPKLPEKVIARLTLQLDAEGMTQNEQIDNAKSENKWVISSNPILTQTNQKRIPVFGELHWHTRLSDGDRSLVDGFLSARDIMNLDFISPADHTPAGDKWETTIQETNRFNEPGIFTTLFGWELSSSAGHANFYFPNSDHPMNPDMGPRGTPASYMDSLPFKNFVAVPHHINATSVEYKRTEGKSGWKNYIWGEPQDDYLRQVEIFQVRGNFECEDPPDGWRTYWRNNGASVRSALAMGHKLGFVAGTDNHVGWPTIPTIAGGMPEGVKPTSRMVTGAWVERRTRTSIFDALYNRHTWACWDTRSIIRFTINGHLQGKEIRIMNNPVNAVIELSIDHPLELLEIISNDKIVWAADTKEQGLDIKQKVKLEHPSNPTYYYVRARLKNGALIYASPIFINY